MMAYVRYVWKNLLWMLLGVSACAVDVCVFGIVGYPFVQALMCLYLVSLFAATPLLALLSLLVLFAIESFIFFSNAGFLVALAIVLTAPLYALRQWLHMQILAPFFVLGLALLAHLTIWLVRGMPLPSCWWLFGYFTLNVLLLGVVSFCLGQNRGR